MQECGRQSERTQVPTDQDGESSPNLKALGCSSLVFHSLLHVLHFPSFLCCQLLDTGKREREIARAKQRSKQQGKLELKIDLTLAMDTAHF